MENLITNNTAELIEQQAVELDQKIKVHANLAWANLLESCKLLKKMKDTKLYEALGYERFGDYTKENLNIEERQAYTYISIIEKQGEAFLQSNASLGITKLALLNAIPAVEREEFVETHDLAGMTVKEIEDLVAENNHKAEQIDMLSDDLKTAKEDLENSNDELDDAKDRIAELEKELEAIQNRPVEVAVAEPDPETLEKIRREAAEAARKEAEKTAKAEKKELKDKLTAEKEKAVAEATQKSQKELEDFKTKVAEAEKAFEAAQKKTAELEKALAVSSSPETTRFTFYFDALSGDYEKILESIKNIKKDNPEIAEKYANAIKKYHTIIAERFEALGYIISEPQREHGYWKKDPESADMGRCSVCNSYGGIDENFCSYCGSEMIGDGSDGEPTS